MPLSDAVRVSLEGELRRLDAERQRLEQETQNIRQLLGVAGTTAGGRTSTQASQPATLVPAGSLPVGFRDAIRSVLKAYGRPVPPKRVAQAMEDAGWQNPSKVPLGTRVSNELWRMHERKLVEKAGRKYHSPKDVQGTLLDAEDVH